MRFFNNTNMNYLDIMIEQVQSAKKISKGEVFYLNLKKYIIILSR